MSLTVGSHAYLAPWWWVIVAWLAASTVLLVWEGVKKVQELRRGRQRSPEPWGTTDFGPYRPTPRTSPPLRYPNAGHVGGGAAPSPQLRSQAQRESSSWRLWLSVAAEVAGILGLLISLVK